MKGRFPSKSNDKETGQSLKKKNSDVVLICRTAEKVFRNTPNLVQKNILEKIIIYAKHILINVSLFVELDMFIEHTFLSNHKLDLINLILKKYFNLRLHHNATSKQDAVQRIRSFHNRWVVFQNP